MSARPSHSGPPLGSDRGQTRVGPLFFFARFALSARFGSNSCVIRRAVATPEQVFGKRVCGRKVIYLDTNAWSDLAEVKTDDARFARDLALKAVEARLAIFPVSFSTITELLRRDVNPDSIAQAELMDTLSDGVAFRGNPHVRDLEILAAYDFMLTGQSAAPTARMFTITVCYNSDGTIVFPDGWTEEGADAFMQKLQQHGLPGVRWLQERMRQPTYLAKNEATDEKYVHEITRKRQDVTAWGADQSGKVNASVLRREEHACVLNRYLLENVLRLATPQMLVRLAPAFQSIQNDEKALRKVVQAMPSTWLSCEINVQRMLAMSRRTRQQDFYDHEHAVLAVPYAQAFVTADGDILDVLRKVRATDRFTCRLARGMSGLRQYLNEFSAN